jgi:sulfotransferase
MKTVHMVSGLPRSGSTLLCNILAQNPRFHATHTSGSLDVLFGIRNNWNNLVEHKAHPCQEKLDAVLRASFQAYYSDIEEPVVFDKSRGWLAYIEFLEHIIGVKAKIIVPVRPMPDILASFETLYRETSKVKQPPGEAQNYFQFQTVQGRCAYWMRDEQVVGLALNRLHDAVRRGFQDRLHFVDFNNLTHYPKQTMKKLYEFLDEDYFDHDFNNVEQVTEENDDIHGFVNLHKIRNKVEPVKSRAVEVLGKDVVEHIVKTMKI